jgi:hypothetical protein
VTANHKDVTEAQRIVSGKSKKETISHICVRIGSLDDLKQAVSAIEESEAFFGKATTVWAHDEKVEAIWDADLPVASDELEWAEFFLKCYPEYDLR